MKKVAVVLAVAGAMSVLGAPAYASSHEEGEKVFKRACASCHTVEAGKNRVGPSLAGVAGRKAAAVDGFKYSEAMKASGITWTDDKIDAYIADPKAVVPKGSMAYAGLKKADDRKAIISYLKHHK